MTEQSGQWIEHARQSPKDGQAVIYYCEDCGVWRGLYADVPGGQYYCESGFLTGDVTHWMPDRLGPLPLRPGEQWSKEIEHWEGIHA
ncbi:MAG: hypothetical protein K9N51_02355 [Candidatus Pacebacteria bacterium]|nr:hypothetical protein [Candidatus Paceibacterota bacterium]